VGCSGAAACAGASAGGVAAGAAGSAGGAGGSTTGGGGAAAGADACASGAGGAAGVGVCTRAILTGGVDAEGAAADDFCSALGADVADGVLPSIG